MRVCIVEFAEGALGKAKKGLEAITAVAGVDPKVIELVNERLLEQDKWNDVFSTKLIELLDKNDAIRAEIRKRLDQIAAASRAQQELIRAADEHRKLRCEYERIVNELSAAKQQFEEA